MNKTEKIAYVKKQLSELELEEKLFKQCLSSITSRKRYLKEELDSLGASSSARKGKYYDALSEEKRLNLLANLTK